MKLSIIIVNFNTFRFLYSCLESIFQGNLSEDKYEIIVVDNASTDVLAKEIKKKYPSIQLIINKENLGFAKANNLGIKKAKGKYILLLNPDTLILKNTLIEILSYMEENPDIQVVTCRVELAKGNLDDACHRGFPTPWNAFCQFSGLARIFSQSRFFNGYHLGYQNMDQIHEIDSCAGAFMFIRKNMGDKIGWLDEDYFWYGEDLDFCFRVRKSGGKIIYMPKVKIIHYKGVASGLKKHSWDISTATKETKIKATKARFEVMETFYRKHYLKIYSKWLTWLVLSGIKLKEYLSLFILNFKY